MKISVVVLAGVVTLFLTGCYKADYVIREVEYSKNPQLNHKVVVIRQNDGAKIVADSVPALPHTTTVRRKKYFVEKNDPIPKDSLDKEKDAEFVKELLSKEEYKER